MMSIIGFIKRLFISPIPEQALKRELANAKESLALELEMREEAYKAASKIRKIAANIMKRAEERRFYSETP